MLIAFDLLPSHLRPNVLFFSLLGINNSGVDIVELSEIRTKYSMGWFVPDLLSTVCAPASFKRNKCEQHNFGNSMCSTHLIDAWKKSQSIHHETSFVYLDSIHVLNCNCKLISLSSDPIRFPCNPGRRCREPQSHSPHSVSNITCSKWFIWCLKS